MPPIPQTPPPLFEGLSLVEEDLHDEVDFSHFVPPVETRSTAPLTTVNVNLVPVRGEGALSPPPPDFSEPPSPGSRGTLYTTNDFSWTDDDYLTWRAPYDNFPDIIKDRLEKDGLEAYNVKSDGNCLYRASTS